MGNFLVVMGIIVVGAVIWAYAAEYFFGEKDDLDDYEDEV